MMKIHKIKFSQIRLRNHLYIHIEQIYVQNVNKYKIKFSFQFYILECNWFLLNY